VARRRSTVISCFQLWITLDGTFTHAFVLVRMTVRFLQVAPFTCPKVIFFSNDEFVAADGAFEGDGCLKCSYKNPGNDKVKKLWNLAFCEVRTGVENSYQ
jgi:hypothetical protein